MAWHCVHQYNKSADYHRKRSNAFWYSLLPDAGGEVYVAAKQAWEHGFLVKDGSGEPEEDCRDAVVELEEP